ncbi:MAG: ATP-binding protein [Arcobacter sp.]|uniref:ATP-binding protein n=1 Tax=Arcobacter sp. TaxID=1872629 RepID=UPI003AFFD1A0
MNKKAFTIYILLSILILLTVIIISFKYLENEEKRLLNTKYTLLSKEIKKNIDFLIEDKKVATLSFSIAASKIERVKNAFISKDTTSLDFSSFSKELRTETKFKNVWFQLINKEGKSIYRSWSKNRNDSLLFRDDIKDIFKNKKIKTTISVGRYDMTFSSLIPVFENNELIGIFEVITHFNSISRALEETKSDTVVFAHKRFFKTVIFPFTNNFIDEYYIANVNAKEYLIDLIKNYGIDDILESKDDFLILNNHFILNYKIYDFENKSIGYIVLSKKLQDIDISEIKKFKTNFMFNIVFTLVILFFILTLIFYYFFSNKIILEKRKAQKILDSQQNIIILTDGENLNNANKQFLVFFNQYETVDEFKLEHKCICEMFIDLNDESYLIEKDYDGKNWAEHILANPQTSFKAAMKKDLKIEHFVLNVNLTQFKGEKIPYIVVTLTNITADIKQKSELKRLNNNLESLVTIKTKELKNLNKSLEHRVEEEIKKNKEKDRILFQQNKMASMGEMLNNIAHQWRQPLSAISTSASSILLKKELDVLDDASINFLCSHIVESSNFLSKTIEDFRILFKDNEKEKKFFLKEAILNDIKLINNMLVSEKIELVIHIPNDTELFCSKNQFQQSILNLINNSIEALIENTDENRLIIISYSNSSLSIQDNAKGIKDDVIEHIFEPYFTTKHKSQGKGLGLYMTKMILEKNMNYKLHVQNNHFIYNSKEYFGANFIINFNK